MAKLYFYYSAMNAGKTTTLLQSAHNYRERGMRVAILTPRLDHRAGHGVVASRIGLQAEATAFDHDTDLQRLVEGDIAAHGRLGCVLVDEAQFLTKAQVWQLSEVVDQLRSYHQGWILLRDDNLAAERVTGLYNLDDPQAALEALVQPHGGRVQRWSPFVLVIDR